MDLIEAIRDNVANPAPVRKPNKSKKKIKRTPKEPIAYPEPVKLPKTRPGQLYGVGKNDYGQLGFHGGVLFCTMPSVIPSFQEKTVKMVACGGNHTLILDTDGIVWSVGTKEDGVLGRPGATEQACMTPGRVEIPAKVKQVSAGESHSAALTVEGEVYAWGCYRNREGVARYGIDSYLTEEDDCEYCERPWQLTAQLNEESEADDVRIIKIVSGANHIAMLGDDSRMYTCGAWDSGQLGREQADPKRLTRSLVAQDRGEPVPDQAYYLKPRMVFVGNKYNVRNVWAGQNATFCCAGNSGYTYVCGDNSNCQLGVKLIKKRYLDTTYLRLPTRANSFNTGDYQPVRWRQIAAGQFHTVALTETGQVYTVGNHTNGRLGLSILPDGQKDGDHVGPALKLVGAFKDTICIQVAAGKESGYALSLDGILYCWGGGEYVKVKQQASGLGLQPTIPTPCDGIDEKKEIMRIAVGGKHVVLTMSEKSENKNVAS